VDSGCGKPRGWPRCWWWPGPRRRARWRVRSRCCMTPERNNASVRNPPGYRWSPQPPWRA